ncbi:MAG: hypothetical protein ABS81_15450 [Pseudonocardia sp. SCN 72-86]|nr:MAG: hypothetical protein ABS81_15450 [Pseudonocardia sp. SCN 72-86]
MATRARLVGAGYTDGELRRRQRDGRLHRVARGSYAAGDDPRIADTVARQRLRVRAALARAAPGAVASHVSAAVLHSLPTWGLPVSLVHPTRDRPGGGRRESRRHVRAASLREHEVTEVDGIAVTTVARTVVDLARNGRVRARRRDRRRGADRRPGHGESLDLAVERAAGRRGSPAAARVVPIADGRSASVGEFDGRMKYGRPGVATVSGDAPADVVWAEKRREVCGRYERCAAKGVRGP